MATSVVRKPASLTHARAAHLAVAAMALVAGPGLTGCASDAGNDAAGAATASGTSAAADEAAPLHASDDEGAQYSYAGGPCYLSANDGPICKPNTGLFCARDRNAPSGEPGHCALFFP